MKRTILIFLLSTLIAACVVAGCVTSPSPTLAPTATPTPAATVSAAPTLIGKSDEAHIKFNYQLGTASEYDGLQKAAPGYLFYLLQVNVSSDKPVQTSPDWFGMEYKVNDTDSVHDAKPFSTYMFKYPTEVLGPDTGAAKGGFLFELPATMADGYPKPYYYMPLEEQQGPYKVYDKVYGTVGDVQ
jgi:hypothetical protein